MQCVRDYQRAWQTEARRGRARSPRTPEQKVRNAEQQLARTHWRQAYEAYLALCDIRGVE